MSSKVGLRYIRVSGLGQADDEKHGLPRQIDATNAKAQSMDIKIVEEYKDVYTGKVEDDNDLNALITRPEVLRLFEDLDSGKYKNHEVYIFLEKLDRLARDVMAQEWLYRQLSNRGAKLVSASDGINLEPSEDKFVSATRKFIRQILGAVAEYDREMIVYKTKLAKDRIRKATGKCEGPSYYGHHRDRPDEIPVLALIKKLFCDDKIDAVEIARELNKQNLPTRKGGPWRSRTIAKILRREEHAKNKK